MRKPWTILAALLLAARGAHAQTAPADAQAGTPPPPAWEFSAAAYVYLVPDDEDYVQPTVTADRGALHLEARYNYEARDAGSVWLGYRFGGGQKLEWELTPILGGVFGEVTAIAPGYEAWLGYWKLELYSEGEYVWDRDPEGSFFYNWSELSLAPVEWFRFGVATQRTRAYGTDREIQRGLLAGYVHERFDLTAYVFNPDDSEPTLIVAARLSF